MYTKKTGFILCLMIVSASVVLAGNHVVWQEAESMENTGKWSNDPQHIDIMGSPYLLATGVGKLVDDSVTELTIPEDGIYTLWVRCRDWFPSHSPGQFQVLINDKASPVAFGKADNDAWQWIKGGSFELEKGTAELRLRDNTGWWGRCDAVVLATGGFEPSSDREELAVQRLKYAGVSQGIEDMGTYDFIVVGGGPAGMGASIAAARNRIKVALIQDRPVLGGNSSSEIEVPPMGFPPQGWDNYADSKKMEEIVRAEDNISLFLNTRAIDVEMKGKTRIRSVIAINVHTGQRMRFSAPLFADTTGHGG